MGRFLDPLILEPQDDGVLWKVVNEFDYHIGNVSGEKIIVPAGFLTDLGSVPMFLWNLIPPIGKPLRGYVLHDYLYASQIYSRMMSDYVLFEAMGVAGVGFTKKLLIFIGVRLGGWIAWNGHKKENETKSS